MPYTILNKMVKLFSLVAMLASAAFAQDVFITVDQFG